MARKIATTTKNPAKVTVTTPAGHTLTLKRDRIYETLYAIFCGSRELGSTEGAVLTSTHLAEIDKLIGDEHGGRAATAVERYDGSY